MLDLAAYELAHYCILYKGLFELDEDDAHLQSEADEAEENIDAAGNADAHPLEQETAAAAAAAGGGGGILEVGALPLAGPEAGPRQASVE